jgi:hypothetical protein
MKGIYRIECGVRSETRFFTNVMDLEYQRKSLPPSKSLQNTNEKPRKKQTIGDILDKHPSKYREYPHLIEVYIPENLKSQKPVVPHIVPKRDGGRVVDVPKPPVPFSLAPLEKVVGIN